MRGCKVTVVTGKWEPRWPSTISFHEVPVVRLPHAPQGGWKTLRYVRSLGAWLKEHRDRYDLVYVSGLKHEACAAVQAAGGDVPVVLRAETSGRAGDCLWQLDALFGKRIKRECMKAAAFVGPSRLAEAELKAAGYPRSQIHCIPNGVPIPPARTPEGQAAARTILAELNKKFQLADGARLAVYAGRFARRNGLEHLLAAWKPISTRRPTARLWLAGNGPELPALSRKIEWMHLTDRVIPTGAFSDIETVLAAADLFVLPSLDGGPAVALLEAMAAGTPIVATDTPGTREVMAGGEHGLTVPPGEAEPLSEAIARTLNDFPEAVQRGAAARRHVSDRFSLAKMVDAHVILFERLLGFL